MRYYVVSDLHSFYTPFMKALSESGFFADQGPKKLIICGDVFDRGREALAMESCVSDLLDGGETILIRGNHEDLMTDLVDFLEHTRDPWRLIDSHYEHNGTLRSLCDLSGISLMDLMADPAGAAAAMRETVAFKKIIPASIDYYETSHYVFLHGWTPCRIINAKLGEPAPTFNDWRNANETDWKCARWMDYLTAIQENLMVPGKMVVCGHRSVKYGNISYLKEDDPDLIYRPFVYDGLIAIDATTVISGRVNVLVVEDD